MKELKGFYKTEGKLWFLNNKKAYENGFIRSLSFGIQTSKDNSVFVQIGEWKNTKLNVKIKGSDQELIELNEQEAIEKIQEVFKDGDSVYINMRSEIDIYNNKLKFLVNQMYVKTDPIDFDSPDFVEVNELNQSVVITEKANNRSVKVGMVNYQGKILEQQLTLTDNDVNDYMADAKVGDVMRLTISVNRKPNYVDVAAEEDQSTRKTLKGKSISSGGKRAIDGYVESLDVVDVDVTETEKAKYDKKEIRQTLEDSVIVKKETVVDDSEIDEDSMPF